MTLGASRVESALCGERAPRWGRLAQRRACLGLLLALALAAPLCGCSRKPRVDLPELGALPPFELRSQDDLAFGSGDLQGHPYVATFMFTRCPSICPTVSARLRELGQQAERRQLHVTLVSISVDGEHDTPAVLRSYAKKHGLTAPRHVLLTGDASAVAETAEKNFKVGVSGRYDEKASGAGISHGSHLVLVDSAGQIRGYFPSFVGRDDAALLEAIAALN